MLAIEKEIEIGLKNGYSVTRFKKFMETKFEGTDDWKEIDKLLKEGANLRAHIYAWKAKWAELEDIVFDIEMDPDEVSPEDKKKVTDAEMKIIWSCYKISKVAASFSSLRDQLDVRDEDVPRRKKKEDTVETYNEEFNYEDHLQ